MRLEVLRPWWFRMWMVVASLLGRRLGRVAVGQRCRFEGSCTIRLGKRSQLYLGERAVLRGGCIIDLGREGNLTLAEQAEIRHYAVIECAGRVSIGRRSVIGAYNWLQGSGEIEIGDDVIIGPGVRIVSTTHDISAPDQPFARQPLILGSVHICNNVWIGADVVILTGVRVGKNVVVGAGSLVTGDLEDNGVYVGTPARRVKEVHSIL